MPFPSKLFLFSCFFPSSCYNSVLVLMAFFVFCAYTFTFRLFLFYFNHINYYAQFLILTLSTTCDQTPFVRKYFYNLRTFVNSSRQKTALNAVIYIIWYNFSLIMESWLLRNVGFYLFYRSFFTVLCLKSFFNTKYDSVMEFAFTLNRYGTLYLLDV